jgi:tetratricopeptide (TPR) repeat protein
MRYNIHMSFSRSAFVIVVMTALIFGVCGCGIGRQASLDAQALKAAEQADTEYNLENVAEAHKWIENAVQLSTSEIVYIGSLSPDNPTVFYVLSKHGDYPEIVTVCDRLIGRKAMTDNPAIYEILGDALERTGRKAESQAAYQSMLDALNKQVPNTKAKSDASTDVKYQLMIAEYKSGNIDEAKKIFADLQQSKGAAGSTADNTFAYFEALDKVNLTEAEALARLAVKNADNDGDTNNLPSYQDTLGWVLYQEWTMNGDTKALAESVDYLQMAASGDPGEGDIHFHIAKAYEASGQLDKARIEYERLAHMHIGDPDAQAQLAGIDGVIAAAAKAKPSTAHVSN